MLSKLCKLQVVKESIYNIYIEYLIYIYILNIDYIYIW